MRLKLDQIQSMLGANLYASTAVQDLEIQAVCRDTRDVESHCLFVCIVGQRFDGHDFALQAVEAGATALLVSKQLEHVHVPQLVVEDTVKALGLLAHAWREMFRGKVIAITGSAGKTTMKECLAQILVSAHKKIARNKLNYNNQIGLPLSMLSASGHEDYWIMEVGISKPHDMDELGAILSPDLALVLNVGAAHTEGLGERGVAWHKAQLLKYVKNNVRGAQAFVCADYIDLVHHAKELCQNIYFFSGQETAPIASCKATYVGMAGAKGKYHVQYNDEQLEVLTPFFGSYGSENVAALVAVLKNIGIQDEEIINGFDVIQLPEQRFNVHELGPWRIIDDSYNANALSMRRMLEAATQMDAQGQCYAVLGAMGELGDLAVQEHEALGRALAKYSIKDIFWKGPHADDVLKGLCAENYAGNFIIVNDAEDFRKKWHEAKLSSGVVLCKGSRSNALEELVNILLLQIKADGHG